MDFEIKQHQLNLGPGYYYKGSPLRIKGYSGFGEGREASFHSEAQCASSEVPAGARYSPQHSAVLPRVPSWPIKKPIKITPSPKKRPTPLNPIYDQTMQRSRSCVISKAKRESLATEQALKKSNFPAPNAYGDTNKTFKLAMETKPRLASIYPYKFQRFTEGVMKRAANSPGPGSYEVGPPALSPIKAS